MTSTMIDWGNPGFLRTYSMAFAASSFLTVIVWLFSVAKRAASGVEPARALGESVGYLLMSVMASTFAPLVVAELTDLVDQLSHVMIQPFYADMVRFLKVVSEAEVGLAALGSEGIVINIYFAIFMTICAMTVWLELIVRNGLLYIGLVMGPTVFAGLVDQQMWQHTKKWAGVMGAVIASKYVTFTVIVLGTGMLTTSNYGSMGFTQALGTLITAVAVLGLALFIPFTIGRFIPIIGDEIHAAFKARQDLQGKAKEAAQGAKNLAAKGKQASSSISDLNNKMSSDDGGGEPGSEGAQEEPGQEDTTQVLEAGVGGDVPVDPGSGGGSPAPMPDSGGSTPVPLDKGSGSPAPDSGGPPADSSEPPDQGGGGQPQGAGSPPTGGATWGTWPSPPSSPAPAPPAATPGAPASPPPAVPAPEASAPVPAAQPDLIA